MNGWKITELRKSIHKPDGDGLADMCVRQWFNKWEWQVITNDSIESGTTSTAELAQSEAERVAGKLLAERELARLDE